MTRRALFTATAVLGTLIARPASAGGEDQDLNALLDEPVVTTASSTAETGTTAPATSSTVTAEDLRRYGIHTLAEAVSFLAMGVTAQHTLDGDELGARGIEIANDTGNHFLLLIDGHKVNDPYQSADIFGRFGGIPLEVVDHIEVVLGPGSVLYGSNAMLGVINVVTKRGRDFEGVHMGVEADVATSVRPWAGFGRRFRMFGAPSEVSGGGVLSRRRSGLLLSGPGRGAPPGDEDANHLGWEHRSGRVQGRCRRPSGAPHERPFRRHPPSAGQRQPRMVCAGRLRYPRDSPRR